ncbi:hypothetical protein J2X69_002118 [Algoriphagus sp. 4150]|uniref:hypothetical protein n=1 Tax=Algoriphagus sp. 4150 TaxID=2817756 RepID=UPI0028664E4A|nr:hypothetical protein [Algoriphagus sp. 4150]MDR7129772.1 hypothetical protein [Algoriphagus sp. 4150]
MNTRNSLTIKNLWLAVGCCSIILLASCGGESEQKSGKTGGIDMEGALSKIESRRKADPNASGGNKCLLGYADRFDELLTEAEVLEATGFSTDVMEVKYSKTISDVAFHGLNYQFDNKRERTIAGYTMPFKDNVQLQRIKPMSLTQFKNEYRAITEEEDQAVKGIIDDVADGNVSGADAKEAKDQLDASGVDKETAKDAMGSLAEAFKEISKGYRNVDGLGDAAVWNLAEKSLTVLDNGVQFEVQVDAKSSPDEDKAIAIALAKKILNKCN